MAHLRATGTCHTLKELEKSLPTVASINSIQVKEYIQALTDENRIRVEKIGTGNWYWSFGSDERIQYERQLVRVKTEVDQARQSRTETMAALRSERMQRETEADAGRETERMAFEEQRAGLQEEVSRLRSAVAAAQSGIDSVGSKGVLQLQEDLAGFRYQAQQWTDNIYILEEYLRRLASGDREIIVSIQRECYGDEYVDGGLRELEEKLVAMPVPG